MKLDPTKELMIEAIEHFRLNKEAVTVNKIVDYLDAKYNFDKKAYANLKHKVYYRIRNLQGDVLEKFAEYQKTKEYSTRKTRLVYYDNAPDTVSQDQFTELIQYGFSPEDVDSMYYDAQMFSVFVADEIQHGNFFLIPNESNEYLIPEWTDYVIYRFQLLGRSAKRMHTQLVKFNDDKYILPSGQIVQQLTMHSDKLKELAYKDKA